MNREPRVANLLREGSEVTAPLVPLQLHHTNKIFHLTHNEIAAPWLFSTKTRQTALSCLKTERFSDNKCILNDTFLIAFSLRSQM